MNISISEIIVVLLIALLVIKPEQLPDLAQTLGSMAKSLRAFFTKLKKELHQALEAMAGQDEPNSQK